MSPSRKTSHRPTARQAEYLAFIRAFRDRYGIAPSFEEIGQHFMTSAPSVNGMVKTLEARGFLRRVPGKARSLEVVVPAEQLPRVARRGGDTTVHDAVLRVAVLMASAAVERLVPVLMGADHDRACGALEAVELVLEMACDDIDASAHERKHARAAFARAVALARQVSSVPASSAQVPATSDPVRVRQPRKPNW